MITIPDLKNTVQHRFINETQDNFVVGINGYKGSGKTLVLTLLLYLDFICGRKIYTNFWVSFPHEIIDIKQLLKFNKNLTNCTIGITEMHVICDARRSGSKNNIMMSYFVLQTRHRSVNLYYDSQFDRQVDIRISENTDVEVVTENMYFDADNDGLNDIFRIVSHEKRFDMYNEQYLYGKPLFNMYDTNVIIDPFTMEKLRKKNIDKLFK